MTPLEKQKRFYSLVILIPVLIGLLWLILGAFSIVLGFDTLIDADFEEYEDEEVICDTNGWKCPSGTSKASNVNPNTGLMSAYTTSSLQNDWTPVSQGEVSFYIYMPTAYLGGMVSIKNAFYQNIIYCYLEKENDNLVKWKHWKDGGWVFVADLEAGTWNKLAFQFDRGTGKYNLSFNDSAWSEDFDMLETGQDIKRLQLEFAADGEYFDDFGYTAPVDERIWAISPASETTITDLDTTFEFGWEALDDWDTMAVVFENRPTGIFSEAQQFIIETTSPSGSMALKFQDFGFDRNGIFYFYGVATRYGIDFVEGMYITGRYSYEWSEDLVNPDSWYLINIEGFEDIFGMSDFEEWYVSISKFTTPTDMFVSIAGFFDPIFGRIGEFGSRIKDYFDLDEVYSQGYEIGKTIPYFSYFVGQISMFFGGFPILKWVGILILILIGFFIFRLVLKFIPFLGGS